jgi:RNA polymerase sigma-70 factor (ECF subfamily)
MRRAKKIFSKIYDQYVEKIYRFIFLKVSSKEIAEDLTSETFLRGWEVFKREKNNIENPEAFLYKIARNLVIDHYREKGKFQVVSTERTPTIDLKTNLEEKAIIDSELEMIKKALLNLKEEHQDALIWYYLNGLSISEIAKILDKKESATRVLISRALKNLRQEYNKLMKNTIV